MAIFWCKIRGFGPQFAGYELTLNGIPAENVKSLNGPGFTTINHNPNFGLGAAFRMGPFHRFTQPFTQTTSSARSIRVQSDREVKRGYQRGPSADQAEICPVGLLKAFVPG
jgi:hypothetical protein